ncbi:hypothetical protein PI126_g15063 [Phytophthora idaei]|nr:hypothetical protein PI126_g15063 [Phytophthora idaei]
MWRRVYAEQEQQPGATGRKSNEDGGDASRRYDDMDDGGVTRAGDIDAPDNFEAAEVSSGARVDPVEPVQLPLDNAKGGDTGSGSDWSHGGDNAGGDDSAGAGASLTGRRSDEVWRVAMRPVITTAETEGRLVPRAIGPIGGVAQSIAVVKNLLHSDAHARERANAFAVVSDRSTELKAERSKGATAINDVSNPAAGSYADGERNADSDDSRGRCDDVDDGGIAGAGGKVLLWLFIVKLLSGEAARAAMKIR